jgi:hypothetical protein
MKSPAKSMIKLSIKQLDSVLGQLLGQEGLDKWLQLHNAVALTECESFAKTTNPSANPLVVN